MLKHFSA